MINVELSRNEDKHRIEITTTYGDKSTATYISDDLPQEYKEVIGKKLFQFWTEVLND